MQLRVKIMESVEPVPAPWANFEDVPDVVLAGALKTLFTRKGKTTLETSERHKITFEKSEKPKLHSKRVNDTKLHSKRVKTETALETSVISRQAFAYPSSVVAYCF